MIEGIGIDITETGRIAKMLKQQPRFVERVLTEREQQEFFELPERRKVEWLSGRFAAKEAFSKATGTGIGKDLSFQDIEIFCDERGKPFVQRPFFEGVHLSISHSDSYAVAHVVIERKRME
ncbi:holo-ACP synthase [Bacillus fonticola]|uniref:holo-ACP synthase n=1 Tax=Bacillus fonticola TaxID=2728853 RepID=UPI0014733E60|nr:holo-ACP synthase [Bacillus fonticola]